MPWTRRVMSRSSWGCAGERLRGWAPLCLRAAGRPFAWLQAGAASGTLPNVDLHEPEPEAYGRITNPERYRVVVDAAQTLVRQLVDTFDVTASAGDAAADFPTFRGAIGGTIRLVPSLGVPLVFAFTPFPGVLIRRGEGEVEAFPSCGCDACDEPPAEVIRRMTDLVQTAVDGCYEEVLFRRPLLRSFLSRFAHLSGRRRASFGYLRIRRRFWRGVGRQPTRRVVRLGPPWPRR